MVNSIGEHTHIVLVRMHGWCSIIITRIQVPGVLRPNPPFL